MEFFELYSFSYCFHSLDLTTADDKHPRRYAARGLTLNLSAITGSTSLATASAPAVMDRQSATSPSENPGQGCCARWNGKTVKNMVSLAKDTERPRTIFT